MSAVAGEPSRLRRPRLAGVCVGLAAYFGLQPAIFRVAFVVLALLGGAGILIYLAAALVVPAEGEDDSAATALLRPRRGRWWLVAALAPAAVVASLLLSEVSLWPRGDAWLFLLAAGALLLWIARYGFDAGRHGRVAAASVASVLLVLLAFFAAAFGVELRHGVGERSFAPATRAELRSRYELGAGTLRLDLRRLELPVGETRVEARVDVGELRVLVPAGVALRARAGAQLGEVAVLGLTRQGDDVEVRRAERGARVLVLDARVGLGAARVARIR
jgi:phage shock protein PspC (stress-responsive transcriptional regulator)